MIVNSACLTGIQEIEVRERELFPSDDELLIKTHAAGICGTDKAIQTANEDPAAVKVLVRP